MTEIFKLPQDDIPSDLREIPEPPDKLYARGKIPPSDAVMLTVVGSRRYSNYGKDVCEELISGLAGFNIAIISGLALGIDAIAHRAALKAGLATIAVPGSGLNDDVIYPAMHIGLAREIQEKGGALLSEFEPNFRATKWSFPKRNRIMAGLSRAVLIIEAEEKSGTLITARLALDYNRDVFVVPNSIFAEGSRGSNRLIRQGAMPVMSSDDILRELDFKIDDNALARRPLPECSPDEKKILRAMSEPISRDELIRSVGMDTSATNRLITAMEIAGLITEEMGMLRRR